MTSEISSTPRPSASEIALVGLAAAGFPLGVAIVTLTWWNAWSWAGAGLMSFSPMIAALLYQRWFKRDQIRPAMRRYNQRVTVTMTAYVFLMMGAIILYERGLTDGPLGYVIALAPALPVIACFLYVARLLKEENDEMQRMILTQALLWSGGLTMAEATAWGFLETFGKVPNVWMWVVPVIFCAQLGLAMPLVTRRYR